MAWTALTETEVLTRLTGSEVTAFKTSALASGQADPLPLVVTQVVDEVRGYIAATGKVTLGASGTIPSKLISATLAVIRVRLCNRLPGMKSLLDEFRMKEYDNAITLFQQVAAGKFAVEEPVTADTETIGAPSPSISDSRTRRFSQTTQDGI